MSIPHSYNGLFIEAHEDFLEGVKHQEINSCLRCGAYDPDYESCTIPSYERVYACPLHSEEYDEHEPNKQ